MNAIKSNELVSESYEIRPHDSRCRYWAKKLDGANLPMPGDVSGANDLPGEYLRNGDIEIFPGEYVIEGEANHHRRQRGWTYGVSTCGPTLTYSKSTKDAIKALAAAGLIGIERAKDLLRGSGGIAACVRRAHLQEIKRSLGIVGPVAKFLANR